MYIDHCTGILKADVSNFSVLSELITELWLLVVLIITEMELHFWW